MPEALAANVTNREVGTDEFSQLGELLYGRIAASPMVFSRPVMRGEGDEAKPVKEEVVIGYVFPRSLEPGEETFYAIFLDDPETEQDETAILEVTAAREGQEDEQGNAYDREKFFRLVRPDGLQIVSHKSTWADARADVKRLLLENDDGEPIETDSTSGSEYINGAIKDVLVGLAKEVVKRDAARARALEAGRQGAALALRVLQGEDISTVSEEVDPNTTQHVAPVPATAS